jgi:hypothetical protein
MWPFKKQRSESDIMIDILEEAARRSNFFEEPFVLRVYGAAELPIVRDLIEEGMVRGEEGHVEGGLAIGLDSITLKGRQLRDELLEKRKGKRFSSRLGKFTLVVLGWIGGVISPVIVEYLKKIAHL